MRKSIKEAIGTTIQDMLDSGFQSSFTKKELNSLGVKIPDIVITSTDIKGIRKKTNLSQAVFAKLLNVSPSSVKQWEQGKRVPTGSTKVLLELLNKSPHLLNYRIGI
ncbi:helix-turn-helix domain-containing protein [Desulfobacula sp.]|uniref:helix-turn-helix domain-containing protein n=1 Tax=Desulfobacula sp. TaxID=2593537 RepID=UPI00260F938F|nr:helix-turn-helix domain-containing protein [Desulfobacula sp.]